MEEKTEMIPSQKVCVAQKVIMSIWLRKFQYHMT